MPSQKNKPPSTHPRNARPENTLSQSLPKTPAAAFTPKQLPPFFRRLLPQRQLWRAASLQDKNFYDRLFTPIVTLWCLIFQRLHFDPPLQAVVADAHAGGADGLCQRSSKKLRSVATTAYSDARQRLPLPFLREALALQAGKMIGLHPQARWGGFPVCLLDGSTLRLHPYGDIAKTFSPQCNQSSSPAYWCLMRVVVCFCRQTGAALSHALAALTVGEQALACRIILKSTGRCL